MWVEIHLMGAMLRTMGQLPPSLNVKKCPNILGNGTGNASEQLPCSSERKQECSLHPIVVFMKIEPGEYCHVLVYFEVHEKLEYGEVYLAVFV